MSRAYNIEFEACASDHGRVDIKMLPVLDRGTMDVLLREEMVREGWKKEEDGTLTKEVGTVKATLQSDNSVLLESEVEEKGKAVSDTDYKAEHTKEIVEKAKKRKEQELQEKAAAKISAAEPEVKKQIDVALQRTYIEAVKQKAASMGNIESIQEGTDGNGRAEVKIKVMV